MIENQEPLVYAVITHWNGFEDTKECAESVLASTYNNIRAVIVDNGSTDGSTERLEECFPEIPVVRTGHNGAVTAAYNAGMKYALEQHADYILMLNNDTVVDPEMVTYLIEAAKSNSNIGIVTAKIYYYQQPQVIWFAGGYRHHFDFGAYGTHEGENDTQANDLPKEVDYAWACGMLFRRQLLEQMGLFDTRFFLYYDDVDMCVRAQKAGYCIWYQPNAKLWHKVSASTGSDRFARTWARSKMIFFRKHTSGLHLWLLIIYAYFHALFRLVFPNRKSRKIRGFFGSYIGGLTEGLKFDMNRI